MGGGGGGGGVSFGRIAVSIAVSIATRDPGEGKLSTLSDGWLS